MRLHSPIRDAADRLIQEAARAGATSKELLERMAAQNVQSSLPQLNRALENLRVKQRRVIRRWEWVMNAAGGFRQYRYWGANFYLDASTAPTVRDETGNPVQQLPPGYDQFRPQVES